MWDLTLNGWKVAGGSQVARSGCRPYYDPQPAVLIRALGVFLLMRYFVFGHGLGSQLDGRHQGDRQLQWPLQRDA